MAKIALPVKDGVLCTDFGNTEHFYIYELEKSGISAEEIVIPPRHEPGFLPYWLAQRGVTDIIANGMERRVISRFQQYKINVFIGVPIKTPKKLVLDYMQGVLETSDNTYDY